MGKKIATREAYGEELLKLGEENNDIVVVEADISKSTRTCYFAEKFPERFFNVGVAEQVEAMISAGLASTGLIPFMSTYAVFGTMRCCEQIRTFICYTNLNVKIALSHGGITPANDGVTHQGTEDMGIMRTMPGMVIIMPTDYHLARAAVRAAAKHKGPVYLRFTRDPVPIIYDENTEFEIGKSIMLSDGDDITLIANGDMTSIALEALDVLKDENIYARLIDMPTIKPIDKTAIIDSAKKTKAIVTIEDHQITNGLGSAVAEVLVENYPVFMQRIGLKNIFAESGEYKLLLIKYEMGVESIVKASKKVIKERKR